MLLSMGCVCRGSDVTVRFSWKCQRSAVVGASHASGDCGAGLGSADCAGSRRPQTLSSCICIRGSPMCLPNQARDLRRPNEEESAAEHKKILKFARLYLNCVP